MGIFQLVSECSLKSSTDSVFEETPHRQIPHQLPCTVIKLPVLPVQTRIVRVPHLGGLDGQHLCTGALRPLRTNLVVRGSWGTSIDRHRYQYQIGHFKALVNLYALGHIEQGQTADKVRALHLWC